MTRHVFPKRFAVPVLAALVAAGAVWAPARAQDEPKPKTEAPADAPAAGDETPEPEGPLSVGQAFPARLPITALPDEGEVAPARAESGAAETREGDEGSSKGDEAESAASAGDGEAATEPAEATGVALSELLGEEPRPVVIVFWSTRCGVCKRYGDALTKLVSAVGDRASVVLVAAGAEQDAAALRKLGSAAGEALALFTDAAGEAAVKLGVRVTPTAFVVGADGVLRYRGPIDDDRRARPRDARALLVPAIESVLAGREVETNDVPPFGSAIR